MKQLLLRFTHSHIPLLSRASASLYSQDRKGKRGQKDIQREHTVWSTVIVKYLKTLLFSLSTSTRPLEVHSSRPRGRRPQGDLKTLTHLNERVPPLPPPCPAKTCKPTALGQSLCILWVHPGATYIVQGFILERFHLWAILHPVASLHITVRNCSNHELQGEMGNAGGRSTMRRECPALGVLFPWTYIYNPIWIVKRLGHFHSFPISTPPICHHSLQIKMGLEGKQTSPACLEGSWMSAWRPYFEVHPTWPNLMV